MAERQVDSGVKQHGAKRVFINNLDSYASKCIAKVLSSCVVGASLLGDGEGEGDVGEQDDPSRPGQDRFHIVGTVSNQSAEKHQHVLEQYCQPERPELLRQLMNCDVIIYNVTQHAEQVDEASWAVSALHNDMSRFSGPKTFILISTVMTWALSKPVDPEDVDIPFTDEDYRRRRAHPNFKRHIDLEKLVVKMGKTKRTLFSTYVVASGLTYGMGEQIFHFFFKTSWLGQAPVIPVFGEGTNIVPTIHISDLASVIQNVIDHKPNTYYLLAVDDSKNTMEDIVKKLIKEVLLCQALGHRDLQAKEQAKELLSFTEAIVEAWCTPRPTQPLWPDPRSVRRSAHVPEKIPPRPRRRNPTRVCYICSKIHKKRSETSFYCPLCLVPLHRRLCFERYHAEIDYEHASGARRRR